MFPIIDLLRRLLVYAVILELSTNPQEFPVLLLLLALAPGCALHSSAMRTLRHCRRRIGTIVETLIDDASVELHGLVRCVIVDMRQGVKDVVLRG